MTKRDKDTNPHVEALVTAWRIGIADEIGRRLDVWIKDDHLKIRLRETVIEVLTEGLPKIT